MLHILLKSPYTWLITCNGRCEHFAHWRHFTSFDQGKILGKLSHKARSLRIQPSSRYDSWCFSVTYWIYFLYFNNISKKEYWDKTNLSLPQAVEILAATLMGKSCCSLLPSAFEEAESVRFSHQRQNFCPRPLCIAKFCLSPSYRKFKEKAILVANQMPLRCCSPP